MQLDGQKMQLIGQKMQLTGQNLHNKHATCVDAQTSKALTGVALLFISYFVVSTKYTMLKIAKASEPAQPSMQRIHLQVVFPQSTEF